jgi:hypothetical protein
MGLHGYASLASLYIYGVHSENAYVYCGTGEQALTYNSRNDPTGQLSLDVSLPSRRRRTWSCSSLSLAPGRKVDECCDYLNGHCQKHLGRDLPVWHRCAQIFADLN